MKRGYRPGSFRNRIDVDMQEKRVVDRSFFQMGEKQDLYVPDPHGAAAALFAGDWVRLRTRRSGVKLLTMDTRSLGR